MAGWRSGEPVGCSAAQCRNLPADRESPMKIYMAVCVAALVGVSTPATATQTFSFPRGFNQASSPDGKWVVRNRDQDKEPNHILTLGNIGTGSRSLIEAYGRSVDVSWSDDSRFLFVNDYVGSDLTECFTLDVKTMKKTKLNEILKKTINPYLGAIETHLYVTCADWHGKDEVFVAVDGYGDGAPNGFHRSFSFNALTRKAREIH
jgi:hypothetical protein